MTTQEKACLLSSLRNMMSINCGKYPLSRFSHLSSLKMWCPKIFPLLIRGKSTAAESTERRTERRAQPLVAVPMVAARARRGNKSSTVCRSPHNILLTLCDCVTGRQVPRSPNNTSSHPENLPFQPLLACVSSREDRPQSTNWKPPQTLGPSSMQQGQPNCCRLQQCPPELTLMRVSTRRQRVLQWKLKTLTMMTRRIFWKSFLWPRAWVMKRAKFPSRSCKRKRIKRHFYTDGS